MNEFYLKIKDIFTLTGRGTIVVGYVNGTIQVGDTVNILDRNEPIFNNVIVSYIINTNRKEIKNGDKIGLLLCGINKDKIKRGYIISK